MTKNGKQMAIATATLVVQRPAGADDVEALAQSFEQAIDTTDVLRRVADATTRAHENIIEVQCMVEYGPVFGNDADMHRHLQRQVHALKSQLGCEASAVFDIVRTELTTPEELDTVIGNLTAKANDIAVSLAMRKQLANVVSRLRRGSDAGRVPRVA